MLPTNTQMMRAVLAMVSALAAATIAPVDMASAQERSYPVLQYGDPRNGNVYAAFLDLQLPGGSAPRVYRAYQSLSPFCGLFGCGWSSDYETYIDVEGDGSVIVHEWGGGTATPYRAASATSGGIDDMVAQIVAAARATNIVRADSVIAYQALLRDNVSFRTTEWKRFVKMHRVRPPAVPVGAQLRAVTPFGVDELERTADGYVRRLADGTVERYDDGGRLTRVELAGKHWLAIARDPQHRIASVTDDSGRVVTYTLDARGRVLRAATRDGKFAAYRYDARGDLVYTRDADGLVITHAYDRWHYLTRIENADSTFVDIGYYPVSMNARVRRVSDQTGLSAEYAYRWTRADSLEYIVDVTLLHRRRAVAAAPASASADGQNAIARGSLTGADTISRQQHRYEERRRASGERWMHRISKTVDGRLTSTTFDEECGVPIVEIVGADSTIRTLDARCRTSTRRTAASTDSLAYDANDHVTFARVRPTSGEGFEARYRYTDACLTSVVTSADSIELVLTPRGRLLEARENDVHLTVARDAAGRPSTIAHSKLGTITVTFAADGTPSVSAAPGTDRDAMRAYTRRLARLLAPAGVDLDF